MHTNRISLSVLLVLLTLAGCSPTLQRRQADDTAARIIAQKQEEALGHTEPFTVEPPSDALRRRLLLGENLPISHPLSLGIPFAEPVAHFPEVKMLEDRAAAAAPPWEGPVPLVLGLEDALKVAARNSREYQNEKENVFRSALALDLERNEYRPIFAAAASTEYTLEPRGAEKNRQGLVTSPDVSVTQRLRNGMEATARLGIDIVKLLTLDRNSSLGIFGDASISIPLLRGSGSYIASEPLTQAERDTVYAIWEFERFKRIFAVRVASEYIFVLQAADQVRNALQNYEGLATSTRRARRLAQAGRLPGIEVGEALQDELTARNRWITAIESHRRRLDSFKLLLGLPPDASVELDPAVLEQLAERAAPLREKALAEIQEDPDAPAIPADAPVVLTQPTREGGGPLEMAPEEAIRIALDHRLDLQVAIEHVYDSQRQLVVAADRLRAELTLLGSAAVGERRSLGSAGLEDARLDFGKGFYSALVTVDLPVERTAERIQYRLSLVDLERRDRELQALEDSIKLEVVNGLGDLLEARETIRIQAQALEVAERRVEAAGILLEAGRAQIRDLLFAQESLVTAQNALTAALVAYRVSELELQQNLGVLEVDSEGLWTEYVPGESAP